MTGAWRTISVALVADTSKYTAGMRRAEQTTDQTGRRIEAGAKRASGAWMTFAKFGAAALIAGLAMAVTQAAQFDATMRNVASLGEESTESIQRLSSAIVDMSTELPQSATTLAEGLYDIESSGFNGADALEVLDASARSASAGLTDTATSAAAITGVLNAYGMTAADAQRVSDVLFQTVNLGVVSFEELAQSAGNYISTAAAAGVSIEEASAAMATITLAGIPASEAATALNRVISSFVKPSEGMSEALDRLGLSVDSLADPAIGLSGVMRALADDTGGNIVAMSSLFPEVRGLKGALALLANEGDSYTRVLQGMTEATDGIGATQKALDEQMKSLSMKWKVFRNQVDAVTLTIGLKLIPVIISASEWVGDVLADASARLGDVWRSLADTGSTLIDVLEDIWSGARPVVEVLGALGAGALYASIRFVAAGLGAVAGLLVKVGPLVEAAGYAFTTWAAARVITTVVTSLGTLVTTYALTAAAAVESAAVQSGALGSVRAAAGLTATTLKGMVAANAGMLALMGGVAALYAVKDAFDDSRAAAEAFVETTTAKGKHSIDGIRQSISDLGGALGDADPRGSITSWTTWGRAIKGTAQVLTPFTENTIVDMADRASGAERSIDGLKDQLWKIADATTAISGKYGISRAAAEAFIQAQEDLDLRTATSEEMFDAVTGALDKTAKATGLTTDQIAKLGTEADGTTIDLEAMQKVLDGARDATLKSNDLLGADFDLGDRTSIAASDIRNFYKQSLADTEKFSDGISQLITAGYDPALISRLIQAGPKDAAPLVAALVQGISSDMVDIVNNAEQEISRLSAQAAEQARITYLATTSASDDMTKHLADAAKISQMAWDGWEAPDIAAKLGLDAVTFNKIADDFGMSIDRIQEKAEGTVEVKPRMNFDEFQAQLADADWMLQQVFQGTATKKTALDLKGIISDTPTYEALMDQLTRGRQQRIDAGLFHGDFDEKIRWLTQNRNMTVNVDADTRFAEQRLLALQAMSGTLRFLGINPRRFGGIDTYAARDGMIASGGRPLIQWGEPGTGGEAYIPRNIPSLRAKKLLDVAAGWHGMQVVPRGGGGGMVYSPTITVDARGVQNASQVVGSVKAAVLDVIRDHPKEIAASVGRSGMAR